MISGSAAVCLARAILVGEDRLAWLMLGGGLAFNAAGEVYYSLVFGNASSVPTPSLDDLLYLLYYPGVYAGLVLLVRGRVERFSASTWLDGAIASFTAAAIIAAVAFEPIMRSAVHGNAAAVATNFAYPAGDLVLLALVVGVFTLSGRIPDRSWLLLGLGLALTSIADTGYLYGSAKGTYVVGGLLDSLWVASALAIGFAAWRPAPRTRPLQLEGLQLLVAPGLCALASLGVLIYGSLTHMTPVALGLAGCSVLVVFARAAWTFHENLVLLAASRSEAHTDALTGLGNRRAMSIALDRVLGSVGPDAESVFVMFDLDGFKVYNDRFGHVAGDALLAHVGARLRDAVAGVGLGLPSGRRRFCVLIRRELQHAERHIARAVAALSVAGDGFSVGTSFGSVHIPSEANTGALALRIADDRMYAKKGERRGSARQQAHDVLLEVLREREPELHHHLRQVGRLAELVGHRLRMDEGQLEELRRAAELHDVGKAAIPDEILNKPGPLDEQEWEFMRRHTIVGERILAAAPALAQVAVIVRSSHERWDGNGYPDRLAGEHIPLAARIVHVCDAFDAMTCDRPYAPAIDPAEALAELRRNAGTQFDPNVVDAFVQAWEQHVALRIDAAEPLTTAGARY